MKIQRPMTDEEYRLVEENIGLAMFFYRMHLKKLQKKADYGVDADDLFSQAFYGLIRAAMRYRAYGEEHGYSEESIATGQYFSVFAKKSIIGQMLDHLRRVDHVHTLVRSDYKSLVSSGLGSSEETLAEIAEQAGMSHDRAVKVVHLIQSRPVYLDDAVGPDGEQTVGEQLSHDSNVESTALETSLRYALVRQYDQLPDLQKFVIAGKYYEDYSLVELAELSGQSLMVIREAHTAALLSLHEAFVATVS